MLLTQLCGMSPAKLCAAQVNIPKRQQKKFCRLLVTVRTRDLWTFLLPSASSLIKKKKKGTGFEGMCFSHKYDLLFTCNIPAISNQTPWCRCFLSKSPNRTHHKFLKLCVRPHICRWACLRSTRRSRSPCRWRLRLSSCAALSRTRTAGPPPWTCSQTSSWRSPAARRRARAASPVGPVSSELLRLFDGQVWLCEVTNEGRRAIAEKDCIRVFSSRCWVVYLVPLNSLQSKTLNKVVI